LNTPIKQGFCRVNPLTAKGLQANMPNLLSVYSIRFKVGPGGWGRGLVKTQPTFRHKTPAAAFTEVS